MNNNIELGPPLGERSPVINSQNRMITQSAPDMEQRYFESIDHTKCQRLEHYLHDAKIEGITEITLVQADPDDGTADFIWCTYYGDCVEIFSCKKSECPHYKSKSGRGRCKHKGRLYLHGDEHTFSLTGNGWARLEEQA